MRKKTVANSSMEDEKKYAKDILHYAKLFDEVIEMNNIAYPIAISSLLTCCNKRVFDSDMNLDQINQLYEDSLKKILKERKSRGLNC